MVDRLPYWMPLNEGNTKTFRYTSDHPIPGTAYNYTKTVTGTDVIKGLKAAKYMVTESDLPFGGNSVGSYYAILPDLSQGKITVKEHLGHDPFFGSYYMIYAPFQRIDRYIPSVLGNKHTIFNSIVCFKEDKTPIDSCIHVGEVTFLGFEDVTVSAGTFKGCMKASVRYTSCHGKTIDGNEICNDNKKYDYFCKSINF